MTGSKTLRGALRVALVTLGICAGQLAGNAQLQAASAADDTLRLVVSPFPSTPGEVTLLVTGGTPGETPVVVLSAAHRAPVEALLEGRASAAEVALHVGNPFPDHGFVEIVVPRPTGAVGSPLYGQAIGLAPHGDPEDPTTPVVVTFVGPMSYALGDKLFCLEDFEIDDPACSITNLGPNVGWMMEDSFGFAQVYSFRPGSLYTETFTGETGGITAEIFKRDDPSFGWRMSVVVGMRVDPGDPNYPPVGSPYFGFGPLKNCPSYLATNGGPIDPGTWHYWETSFGTLLGMGGYAGARASLDRFGAPFQVGLAANTANLKFGVGAWFDVVYLTQPTSGGQTLPMGAPVNGELFGQTRPCPTGMSM